MQRSDRVSLPVTVTSLRSRQATSGHSESLPLFVAKRFGWWVPQTPSLRVGISIGTAINRHSERNGGQPFCVPFLGTRRHEVEESLLFSRRQARCVEGHGNLNGAIRIGAARVLTAARHQLLRQPGYR